MDCCKKLSKTEELIFLRNENKRLSKLVDQLQHNDYKGKSFHAFFKECQDIDNMLFDPSYFIGFLTITFDRKFVFFQRQSDQLDYIQQSIYKAFKGKVNDYNILFGVEHHKDGVLHAHMLIQSKQNYKDSYTDIVNYRYELGLFFTDREQSMITVRLDEVNNKKKNTHSGRTGHEGCIDYIFKEGFKIYRN